MHLFASCVAGLERLLAEECRGLGVAKVSAGTGGVSFETDPRGCHRALLKLGLAQHLLLRLGRFEAKHLAELRRKATAVAWDSALVPGRPRSYVVHSTKSRLYHTEAIAERVELAIAERLGDTASTGAALRVGERTEDGVVVHVGLRRDRVLLSVDLAGEPLWRRGYRKQPGRAPLREDLARGVLSMAGVGPGVRVLDPMFGSGTLLIEAALLEAGRPPGAHRLFAMRHSALPFDALNPPIEALGRGSAMHIGGDQDAQALAWSQENAARAQVCDQVAWNHCSLKDLHIPAHDGPTVLAANPPYGKRLTAKDSDGLYRALGRCYATLPEGSGLAILAPRPELLDRLGIACDRVALPHGGSRVWVAIVQCTAP